MLSFVVRASSKNITQIKNVCTHIYTERERGGERERVCECECAWAHIYVQRSMYIKMCSPLVEKSW
jgi:hypothetical protein